MQSWTSRSQKPGWIFTGRFGVRGIIIKESAEVGRKRAGGADKAVADGEPFGLVGGHLNKNRFDVASIHFTKSRVEDSAVIAGVGRHLQVAVLGRNGQDHAIFAFSD